jgi:hypothetical protein
MVDIQPTEPGRVLTRHDELALRFDADPDAIEWARGKILRVIDQAEQFEKHAQDNSDMRTAARWRITAAFMRTRLIGGEGCVIAYFDARLPQWVKALKTEGRDAG